MKTIFNFGNVHKNYFKEISNKLLRNYKEIKVPITNIIDFKSKAMQIVSPCYGPPLVIDTLSMMKNLKLIKENDYIIFLGSIGSVSKKIRLNDFVIPTLILPGYLDKIFGKKDLKPDKFLLKRIKEILNKENIKFIEYKHGTACGVFDPHTDHINYKNDFYDESVLGLDCEIYSGFAWCYNNNVKCIGLLVCADDPLTKIDNIPREEFNKKAKENDFKLNEIALKFFKNV